MTLPKYTIKTHRTLEVFFYNKHYFKRREENQLDATECLIAEQSSSLYLLLCS